MYSGLGSRSSGYWRFWYVIVMWNKGLVCLWYCGELKNLRIEVREILMMWEKYIEKNVKLYYVGIIDKV